MKRLKETWTRRASICVSIAGLAAGLILGVSAEARAQDYLSPCDLDWSADGSTLYITASTGRQVLLLDVASRRIVRRIALPSELTGTAVSHDGRALFVTGGGHEGKVFKVDAASGSVNQVIEVGHTPRSPVLSPDGTTLYVCNQFDNDIAVIELETGKVKTRIPVVREPFAADLSSDGKTLFVANLIPDGAANVDYVASEISAIDVASGTVQSIKLVNGAESVRGLRVSPDGTHVFATHLIARFHVPTTQLERGWILTDGLSVIRVADQKLLYTVLLDDVDLGFANPWAIGFSDDARTLLVSAAGSHELSLIDLAELTAKIEAVASGPADAASPDTHSNLSFLNDVRRRVPLAGTGPRAIAVRGQTAFVANTFSDTIDCVDLANTGKAGLVTLDLNPGMQISQVRQGEIYFNDASHCFQKWLSCAGCHPDARTDGLNWDLLNDGIGNPKNAKSLVMSHQTPRAMWLGIRADAEAGVRAGLRHIQFAVRPEADAQAIDAYLRSLKPEPSPYLVKGQLSEPAKRGKKLFEAANCISCHPAPLYTDLQLHDVGTTRGQDVGRPVDVPTLLETWRNAPYLHDGRAETLKALFTVYGHAGFKESLSTLSENQLNDLIEFVNSL